MEPLGLQPGPQERELQRRLPAEELLRRRPQLMLPPRHSREPHPAKEARGVLVQGRHQQAVVSRQLQEAKDALLLRLYRAVRGAYLLLEQVRGGFGQPPATRLALSPQRGNSGSPVVARQCGLLCAAPQVLAATALAGCQAHSSYFFVWRSEVASRAR